MRGHRYGRGLFSVTLVGWVYVTMVKKNTSRVGREEVSPPLVGIVPSVCGGLGLCHDGEEEH